MTGLIPTSNTPHQIVTGGSTVPQVQILNPEAATDGVKSGSEDDSNNTKIIAGQEIGGNDNGYSGWDHVYLQYDFGKVRDVKEIDLYHNTYPNAVSTFKDVKVELSSTEDFAESTMYPIRLIMRKPPPTRDSLRLSHSRKSYLHSISVSGREDIISRIPTAHGKATAMAFSLMK